MIFPGRRGRNSLWGTLGMALGEKLASRELPRVPEPEAMAEASGVSAFDREGTADGALLPVYHFNAMALSRMLPRGGRLLDLGSGSGRFLAYLAERRPDVSVVGLELSETMAGTGRRALAAAGLDGRVSIEVGDMTELGSSWERLGGRFDAVSCVYALHHLPDEELLAGCLAQVAAVRARCGAGVWIFDHARPRGASTAALFPEIFTPEAPEAFRRDSRNSLRASFSFEELGGAVESALGPAGHALARVLPVFQAHWIEPGGGWPGAGESCWREGRLPVRARFGLAQLRLAMRGAPWSGRTSPGPARAGCDQPFPAGFASSK